MYVDADKVNSAKYYELGLELLRPGGIIGMDNMFLGGYVVDSGNNEPNTLATRELAIKLLADERVDYSLLPVGDGLGIALKR
jgi:O-methyltransferase